MTLITFYKTDVTYNQFIDSMTRHIDSNALIQGSYGKIKNGRFEGCHVGCTLHDFGISTDNHQAYETLFGIPQVIAYLCDAIHEGSPDGEYQQFFMDFRDAIQPNQDLNMVWVKFALWMLVDESNPYRLNRFPEDVDVIEQVANVYRSWLNTGSPDEAAARAARAAARAAAMDAARNARNAWAARAARAAAWAAARTAARAAWAAARAAARTAENNFWQLSASKLIELIKDAPIVESEELA